MDKHNTLKRCIHPFLFYRYQAEVSEDSVVVKTKSFSITELIYPPLQATTRTSKNVSVSAVFVGK